ncbi:hypothetical protein [Photobacterium nomapromontoriensis]|uniref:hypothetical protein n=1 Tax=Photobacterium nomapromontoriensis TaxID=2910237 RepID=UPI003D1059C1
MYLGGSEDEFKLMCRLLNYYLYLDELGFVSCKGKKLKDPILNTIRDKSYLLNEHHVLTRNLFFIPTLNRIGICDKEETWVKTSPLCVILSSLSDKERASRFVELHPASHSKGAQLSRKNKVWFQEHRQSLESYREIISEFTGESYTNFEESSPFDLFKVLYLLISSNQLYALSIKPLLKSLNNKPYEPMFDTTYDLSYIVDIVDNGEKTKNINFLKTRDKNNPNLTKAILNELLTYLLDSCEPNKARSIREISIGIKSLKTDLLALYDNGYSDRHIKKITFMQLEKLLNPFTSLRIGKSLFEKMSLAMVIKDVVNQLISEKEVLLKASASYDECKPTFSHYQNKIAQDLIFKRILDNRNSLPEIGVSKKQTSNSLSHRKILAIFGLHHYLNSIGILSDKMDFDTDEIRAILLIVFDESERRTPISFIKNIPSSDNLGSTSTWNSLLRYSIAVMFSSDTNPDKTASHFMPYVHQLFWQERYQQVLRLMYTPDSYNRYVSSKQLLLTNLIEFLNNPSVLTRERLISYFFSMKI